MCQFSAIIRAFVLFFRDIFEYACLSYRDFVDGDFNFIVFNHKTLRALLTIWTIKL